LQGRKTTKSLADVAEFHHRSHPKALVNTLSGSERNFAAVGRLASSEAAQRHGPDHEGSS
jgi:hypothetical protein